MELTNSRKYFSHDEHKFFDLNDIFRIIIISFINIQRLILKYHLINELIPINESVETSNIENSVNQAKHI
jgi:hypothetical protein